MESFFNYLTPIIYWILILTWGYIFVFYVRKRKDVSSSDKLLKLLLLILAIDAFRTFFESVYFGARHTSLSGLIPIAVFNYLSRPQIVFFPKIFNLITAMLVLTILIKKWLSAEINYKKKVQNLVKQQTGEIIEAKEKLEESEAKFKKLSNLTFEGILIHDNGIALDLNRSFEKMFGYSREELLGKDIVKILFPKKFHKILSEKRTEEYTFPYEIEGIRKDGFIFPIEIEARNFIEKNNKKTYRVAAVRDITIRKKTEGENKKLLTAVEQSANTVVITDINGNIEYTNPKFTDITGYTREEAMGENPRILNSGTQPVEYYKEMWQTITAGEIWKGQFRNIAKDGKYFWEQVTITPVKNDTGEIINYLAIKEDITERKKAEMELSIAQEAIKKNEEFFSNILRTTNEGFWSINKEAITLQVNPEMCKILGRTESKITGKSIFEFVDKKNAEIFKEHLKKRETGLSTSYEIELLKRNGKNVPCLFKTSPIYNKENKRIGSFAMVTNISRLKNAFRILKNKNEELIISKEAAEEASRLKTEFLNNMSHEIRTPLSGILGFSEMLGDSDLTGEKRKQFIEIIQNSGKQLLHIIDDILEISSLGAKQVKVIENPVCLNDVFLELFSTFNINTKEKKVPLYFKKNLSNDESTILTDDSKLKKVLSKVLENAFIFTNKGFIEFGYNLKVDREPVELEIYVKDTGIGIEQEKHKVIFKRFSQAEKELSKKYGGLGLGLTIAKENTKLLGGKISLKSKVGEGSTFFITIPYKPVNLTVKTKEEQTVNRKDKYTILIAEDEHVNYMFMEILLVEKIKLSCDIIHVENGQDAVEICKKNMDIDFVLMDIKMPKMSGHEATRLIKEFRPNLPVIAQTAYSTLEDREKAIRAGCDDFITKPINKKTLNNVLNTYLIEV